ncbi:MAG: hypothetical protein AB4426_01195 [Xenococcaceae cyanobacterium]
MPGTKASGRPGGNPDFGKKIKIESNSKWGEPLIAKLTVMLPPSMLKKLKSRSDYPECVRDAIAEKLSRENELRKAG